jgi:acyl carrier protein
LRAVPVMRRKKLHARSLGRLNCAGFGMTPSSKERLKTKTELPPWAGRFPPSPLWYAFFLNPQLTFMPSVKEQLKPIILKSLRITDMTPDDLRDDQPLLGGELEIDSIDILQLVLEIERHFGIKLVQANFDKTHFESIDALAAAIESKVAALRT